MVVFTNEIAIGNDGWAQLAPFGDYAGTAMLRQSDGSIKKFPAFQRLDKQAADGMVANFKSAWQRVKRYFTGCPIYVGHPDVPAFANDYPDKVSKGMITDLAVRDDGLYCKPVFTNEGSDLVETKRYRAFSGYWSADPVGEENGKQIYRPDLLKSAGLTNKPNLPVHLMNEASQQKPPTQESMKKIITWLAKHGITIANESTEDQALAALEQLEPKLTSVATLANEKATLSNEKQTLTGTITARESTITQLTQERDTARTNFANERKARVTAILDVAVGEGRITAAERPQWETRLGNEASFTNETEALGKLEKKVKTNSITLEMGGRKVEIANAQDRKDAVDKLVKAEMAVNGNDYGKAYSTVQRLNPALFAAMKQPEIEQ